MWNRQVFIRIVEVLLCISCVITLRVTDDESRRVFHYLRSRSREWFLLNNITWGTIGAALATATCGGYVIITTGLLIAAATRELRGRKTELFLLGLGVILFGIVGALSLASIEDVPQDLIDNAAVFGALCLFTALVFITDLLMGAPKTKDKSTQGFGDKNFGKKQMTTTLTTEKESTPSKSIDSPRSAKKKDDNGNINDAFEKVEERRQKSAPENENEDLPPPKDVYYEDRNRSQDHREPREYAQNFENGRAQRDSQRKSHRDSYEIDRRTEMPTVVYKTHDIYRRPVDEVDTPRFPVEMDTRREPVFAKILNPGVKIMKVEHDVDEAFDAYRYSDSSQYDNLPIRMRGTSSGILKKNRDVSFNVPPPSKGYKGQERTIDEIEMLEECFGSLRTSTGTQTPALRTPSSPNDPGYVRHTANNWPHESHTKTPGSSPTQKN